MSKSEQTILILPIGSVRPDPNQPRTDWDEHGEHVATLASSYAVQGIIVPLEVDENNMITLGECRWRAAKKAGLKQVPVRRVKNLTTQERLERQLVDDFHKELNTMEKVWAYATGVANINDPFVAKEEKRKSRSYTIPQIKKMWEKNPELLLTLISTKTVWDNGERKQAGQSSLADRLGISQPLLSYYLKYFDERVTDAQRAQIEAGNLTLRDIQYIGTVKSEKARDTISKAVSKERASGVMKLDVSVMERTGAISRLEKADADEELIDTVAEGLIKPDAASMVAEVKSKKVQKKIAKVAKAIDDPDMRAVTVKRAAAEMAYDEYTTKKAAEFQPTEEQKLSAADSRRREEFFWEHPDMKEIHSWKTCENFLYFTEMDKAFCPVCEKPASIHLRFTCHPDKSFPKLFEIAREKWEKMTAAWKVKRKKLDEEEAWKE